MDASFSLARPEDREGAFAGGFAGLRHSGRVFVNQVVHRHMQLHRLMDTSEHCAMCFGDIQSLACPRWIPLRYVLNGL